MKGRKRTHHCGELGIDAVGERVVLMGWVDTVRDLGGITFIDLRDRGGVTQIVVSPEAGTAVIEAAKRIGAEWVVAVEGEVVKRAKETVNPNIATGEVEVSASMLEVLSEAKTPPFEIEDVSKASEDLRLRYRYLDLRRNSVRRRLEVRSELAFAARRRFHEEGFSEIETPYLTKSTPEGARDYLVPSRVHKGYFYALPQSPQLFKQLLMIAGMEKYFQIVRCFRDEDLRADRQPEFTQIDIEMSFIEREDIYGLVERLFVDMMEAVDIEVKAPFSRLTYDEAVARFGTDKPDTRFGCEIVDLSKAAVGTSYTVFDNALEQGGVVRALLLPGCAKYSRKDVDLLEARAKELGAAGLGWARWTDEEIKSPLLRQVSKERLESFFETAGGGKGDLLLVVAGGAELASTVLGTLRLELGKREGLIPGGRTMSFLWVTDFPYFSYSESEGRWEAMHHPFTAPHPDDLELLDGEQGKVRSLGYDVVANGYELGGGSIRIHRSDVQERVFKALGLTPESAQEKFGFFLEALQYGAPPHGGIALGLDRIAMLAAGATSLRDVIAFPKTTSAYDLMTGSPSDVSSEQLAELGISLTIAKKERRS